MTMYHLYEHRPGYEPRPIATNESYSAISRAAAQIAQARAEREKWPMHFVWCPADCWQSLDGMPPAGGYDGFITSDHRTSYVIYRSEP